MASKKLLIKNTELYDKHKNFIITYSPLNDIIDDKNISTDTIMKYHVDLASYCCSQNEFFDKLLEEARNEENINLPYSERTIKKRLLNFEEFLKKEGYNTNTSKKKRKNVQTIYRLFEITIPKNNQQSEEYLKCKEQIRDSDLFEDFIEVKRELENTSTIDGYLSSLTGYCLFYKMTLEELIKEAEDEEVDHNIRKHKRKIKRRLEKYRTHLKKKGYIKSTIDAKMGDIIFFFAEMGIDIPRLSKPKNQEPVRELRYDEIPTAEHVKRAIETTQNIKNRALFAFCFTSGTASKEARSISIGEYMEGTEYYHHEKTDITKALEKMDGQTDVIPTFPMHRHKSNRPYYTCITPEANQFIINYLKTREGLTLNDKLFEYTRKGLTNTFQYVNDLNDWGWVKDHRHRFFTCHQLRRANANVLYFNQRLADMIQGRKFDKTTEAYFQQDPQKVRDEYWKHVEDLILFSEYEVIRVTDDKYDELKEKYDEMVEAKDEIIEEKNNEITELNELLDQRTKEIENNVNTQIEEKINNMKEDLISDLSPNELKANTIREEIYDYINENSATLEIENDDISIITELATTLALKHESTYNNENGIKRIIQNALFELKLDKTLERTLGENIEENQRLIEHAQDIGVAVMKYVKENDLENEYIGGENEGDKLIGYLMDNKEKYAESEITDTLIIEVLREIIYYDDVEYY